MIVSGPGEVFTEIGLAVRERSPGQPTLYSGYTNGAVSYFATSEAFAEGGYEPAFSNRTYGLPAPLAPGCDRLLVERGVRLAESLFPECVPFSGTDLECHGGALRLAVAATGATGGRRWRAPGHGTAPRVADPQPVSGGPSTRPPSTAMIAPVTQLRVRRNEMPDPARDFLGLSDASQRHLPPELGEPIRRVAGGARVDRRRHRAGTHARHADALRRELRRHVHRHVLERRLRQPVDRLLRPVHRRRRRRHVDDDRRGRSPQRGQRRLHEEVRGTDVEREHAVELVQRHVRQVLALQARGVVDDDVEASSLCEHGLDDLARTIWLGQVGDDDQGSPARGTHPDLRSDFLERLATPADECDRLAASARAGEPWPGRYLSRRRSRLRPARPRAVLSAGDRC